jgi:hypothetical protein
MAHLAKDASGIFVYKVENALFKLYQAMQGDGVDYVVDREFDGEIRSCVTCFYWEKTRHVWVVRQEIAEDDEKALEVIEKQVCVHLAAAAEVGEDKRRYSAAIQNEFERIWRYVREWLGEDEEETRGGESTGELLPALKDLVSHFDK